MGLGCAGRVRVVEAVMEYVTSSEGSVGVRPATGAVDVDIAGVPDVEMSCNEKRSGAGIIWLVPPRPGNFRSSVNVVPFS